MASFLISTLNTSAQTLINGEGGIITGTGQLALLAGDAITSSGKITLAIQGSIVALTGSALEHNGNGANVSVTGDVQTGTRAFNVLSTTSVSFTNTGTIIAGASALALQLQGPLAGVNHLTNAGLIRGSSNGVVMAIDNGTGRVNNTGTIIGESEFGMLIDSSTLQSPTGTMSIRNTGTIIGSNGSIVSNRYSTIVTNAGTLMGSVSLSALGDQYLGSLGRLVGTVFGGGGNDILIGGAEADSLHGGLDDDTVIGNGGDDELFGFSGIDLLRGGDGNDTLNGGADADNLNGDAGDDILNGDAGIDILNGGYGDDLLNGGTENDTLNGWVGNDELNGDAGDDKLFGVDGNDTLNGGAGADILSGGAGDDVLHGGTEKDDLYGGAGADRFLFNALVDSPNSAASDVIRDYEIGFDRIDFDALPVALTFVGTAAHTGGGTASIRVAANATLTSVFVDTDGNGSSDMRILLIGNHNLTANDFIF